MVALGNGSAVETMLPVGADGAWSRVHALLTGASPADTDISFIKRHLAPDDPHANAAAALIGRER